MAAKSKRLTERTISFEIKTRKPLSVGEQVFVTGNINMLGNWHPDGFPLTRMGENLWFGSAIVPAAANAEFKVTRGSWDDEEILEDGSPPPNGTIRASGDAMVRKLIFGWKDGM
ncbi:MAG: CBM20 domain-containing protein [bacterium]